MLSEELRRRHQHKEGQEIMQPMHKSYCPKCLKIFHQGNCIIDKFDEEMKNFLSEMPELFDLSVKKGGLPIRWLQV